jgi:hypothetical protein
VWSHCSSCQFLQCKGEGSMLEGIHEKLIDLRKRLERLGEYL